MKHFTGCMKVIPFIVAFSFYGYAVKAQNWVAGGIGQRYWDLLSEDLGIGTSNPLHKLDVNGNINTSNSYKIAGTTVLRKSGSNIYVGQNAGLGSSSFTNGNIFVGENTGMSNQGNANTFVGEFAGFSNLGDLMSLGSHNTYIGQHAGFSNRHGWLNVAIGSDAGPIGPNDDGNSNTLVGTAARSANNISNATAIGAFSRVDVSDAMVLGQVGVKVGIGLTAPAHTLHIKRTSGIGNYAFFSDSRLNQNDCHFDNAAFAVGTDNSKAITVFANLNSVGCETGDLIESFFIYGSGDVWGKGDFYAKSFIPTSDAKFKKNVQPVENALSIVKQLRGKKYDFNWDEKATTGTPSYGFIAQEVQKVIPELVLTSKKGYLGVNYDGIIPFLAEAIKEQQTIIEGDKQQMNDLKKELEALKQQIASCCAAAGPSGVSNTSTASGVQLDQNTPNPFDKNTIIRYFLPAGTGNATLAVFDLNGKQVKTYPLTEGHGNITIEAKELSPGMYLYSLLASGKEVLTKRMVVTE